MDDNRLENKVDKISDDIVEIKIIMTENTASLKEHMRRTALAEKNILLLNGKFEEDIAQINSEISDKKSRYLRKHNDQANNSNCWYHYFP